MAAKPLIVVVGATGKQGTGVVRTLLSAGTHEVRAITRNASSPASDDLKRLGAQLYESSPSDLDQLSGAFQGAQAVFSQTPHGVSESFEVEAALSQARAASSAGVQSFIFSSLENVDGRSQGKYHVPYFSAKARAVAQIAAELPHLPVTVLQLAYFYTNLLERFRPWKDSNDEWVFSLPVPADTKVPWTDPLTSVGPVVAAILREPATFKGQTIPIVNELLSPHDMAEQFMEVTGLKARGEEMSKQKLFAWDLPEEMKQWQWDMYCYTVNLGYYAPERNLTWSRKLDPSFRTWKSFLQQTGFDGRQSLAEVRQNLQQA